MSENDLLLKNAVKVLKVLDTNCASKKGTYANLVTLNHLLNNTDGMGLSLIRVFPKCDTNTEDAEENEKITDWFLNEYFPENSVLYARTVDVRTQIASILENPYLTELLCLGF